MIDILFNRFYFLRLHYHLLRWRIYCAAPKRFKIYDLTAVDSSDHEDEMGYLSESFGNEADW